MSPILDVQQQWAETGRIRIGHLVPTQKGGTRPVKLDTFRITSPSRIVVESAAEVYGGTVTEWNRDTGQEWQVVTDVDRLPVIIPGVNAVQQYWELWTAAGCQRRCDGQTETLTGKKCMCPAVDERRDAKPGTACQPTTRLRLMLPEVRSLGMFLFSSRGYYAAAHHAAVADLLAKTGAAMIPGFLRLDHEEQRRPGEQTKKFGVARLEFPVSLNQLAESLGVDITMSLPEPVTVSRPELPAGPPVPDAADWDTEDSPDLAIGDAPPVHVSGGEDTDSGGGDDDGAAASPAPPPDVSAADPSPLESAPVEGSDGPATPPGPSTALIAQILAEKQRAGMIRDDRLDWIRRLGEAMIAAELWDPKFHDEETGRDGWDGQKAVLVRMWAESGEFDAPDQSFGSGVSGLTVKDGQLGSFQMWLTTQAKRRLYAAQEESESV